MVRRKVNVYYKVTCPKHWFEYKDHKSSYRYCKTFEKALSVAIGVKNLHPDEEVVITKFYRKKGDRWCREYVLQE